MQWYAVCTDCRNAFCRVQLAEKSTVLQASVDLSTNMRGICGSFAISKPEEKTKRSSLESFDGCGVDDERGFGVECVKGAPFATTVP